MCVKVKKSRMNNVFVGGLFCLLFSITHSEGLQCLSCDSSTNPVDCLLHHANCDSNTERCFLDELITDNLEKNYQAGCRSSKICDMIMGGTGKRKRDLIACAQCCNTTNCNADLCSIHIRPPTTTVPPPLNGLKCLSCTKVSSLTECATKRVECRGNEVCFTEMMINRNLQQEFSAGCRQKVICPEVVQTGKRNDRVACSQCCSQTPSKDGVPCNGRLCGQNITEIHYECGMCDRVEYPTLCQSFSKCAADEVCQVKEYYYRNNVFFQLRCRQKSICDADLKNYKASHPAVGKRAAVEVCSACCEGDRCNQGPCQILAREQTCYDQSVCS